MPQGALIELLGRVGASQGATVLINDDELSLWPGVAVAAMKAQRLLAKARPASSAICPGCERDCVMPVHVLSAEGNQPARAFISCDSRDDVSRVPVPISKLEQWQTTGELIADLLARLLGLTRTTSQAVDGEQWHIGVLRGNEHRSPVTLLAGDCLNLSLAGHVIPLVDVLTIEENAITLDKSELIRLVDKPAGDSKTIGADHGASENQCAVFLAMQNLTADEVSIAFVGDKNESGVGANDLLEISARGEARRVALAAIDLIDLHRRSLNSQCAILLGMAQKKKLTSTDLNKKKISRLREVFRKHLGISADPFDPYRKGAGWEPRFKIYDNRGAAEERAKREAERRTDSYEQMNESGEKAGNTNQTRQSFDSEDDDADAWLRNNDLNEPA